MFLSACETAVTSEFSTIVFLLKFSDESKMIRLNALTSSSAS